MKIKAGILPEIEEVGISEMKVTYFQIDDQDRDEYQELEVSTDDNGAGTYYVIRTERWAIDCIDELVSVLKDFEKRLSVETDDK
ncbi:hypothetical protein [Petrimonas sulfuriphila]|uniref:hypothetical protein n=1 Tax=Petrimonas sulfuriphila TaxID=285070 RepID=UPI003EBA948B